MSGDERALDRPRDPQTPEIGMRSGPVGLGAPEIRVKYRQANRVAIDGPAEAISAALILLRSITDRESFARASGAGP